LPARGLVKGKTQTIGFLTGSVIEVTSAMMTELGDVAREDGYGVYIADTKGELELTVKQAHELMAATAYSLPPLSTVALAIGEMTHAAFTMLMDGIENNNSQPKEVV